ncbi:seipin-2 [Selaginella moellendorffii]|uniref:seipin-2 n=1 Tax=Selaginella moellendorffii TaxID=88036 RepID=UPI000D1CC753|nr:seipin-2 [Selaginella moellendorffii]XP_024544199.1 seipin-2 [Selaginella moellendorffii]|eukprot:XP_024544198.1 seipin-2 [Selaginella moellendorffii]
MASSILPGSVAREPDSGCFPERVGDSASGSSCVLHDEEVAESSGFRQARIDKGAEEDSGECSASGSGRFEVPDVDNGWEVAFDSDEDDGGKHPDMDRQPLLFENGSSSNESQGADEQDEGLTMPPLVEKSACFETAPVPAPAPHRRREVYKMPTHKEQPESHLLLWPVGFLINAIGFQFKMIGYTMSIAMLLFSICFSMVTEPIHRTVEAKNKVTGKISDGISVITQLQIMLWEAAADIGPKVSRMVKRMGYGVLSAAYVFMLLNLLLVPAILMDMVLMSRLVEEPVQLRESINFDYTEARPSARVPLFPQVVTDKSVSSLKAWAIPKTHSFHITATLQLPESDHNIRLGMFQVTAEILAVNGVVLSRFTHPCMLRYRSRPIRYAKTAMLAVPLILGLEVESQTLVLKLVEAYEERSSSSYPGSAKILLEPRAGFGPGAGLPEIYNAEVLVQSQLPWLKSVLYKWKWTCYVWGAVLIFVLEVAAMVCCCRNVLLVSPSGASPEKSPAEEQAVRRPARRKRVSFKDDLPRARAAAAGIGTRPSDIDKFVEKELEALSGTKEKLSSVQEGGGGASSQ